MRRIYALLIALLCLTLTLASCQSSGGAPTGETTPAAATTATQGSAPRPTAATPDDPSTLPEGVVYDRYSTIDELVKVLPSVYSGSGEDSVGVDIEHIGQLRVVVKGEPDFTGTSPVKAILDPYGYKIVSFSTKEDAGEFVRRQEENPLVEYAEFDHLVTSSPADPAASAGTYGAFSSWGTEYVEAPQMASNVLKADKNDPIIVAVVDTGCSLHHEFLSDRLVDGYDLVDSDDVPEDEHHHGTHVAGTIVDCTPGLNVRIMPVRVLNASGSGSTAVVGYGIRCAAEHGARVINLSLGGGHDRFLDESILYAKSLGVTVCVAAGNEGSDADSFCPAHINENGVIVVGAIDSDETIAPFSNYGKSVDIAAPGVMITSSLPDNEYGFLSGTSMATPHVSAAAAMVRMLYPSYSPADVENLLRSYARDLGPSGRDDHFGAGSLKLGRIGYSAPDLSSIYVKRTPDKTEYNVGDRLDTTGLVIAASYSDGSEDTLTDGFECSPTVFHTTGRQTVAVTYRDKTAFFTVDVRERSTEITRLSVSCPPIKTEYDIGDTLETSGLILSATYEGGYKEFVLGGFTCNPTVLTNAGMQTIVVTYRGKTATFNVTVRESPFSLTRIAVGNLPSKTEYKTGDTLNTAGLELTAYYDNGSVRTVTSGFACDPTVLNTAGTQKITVTFEGKTTSFNVTVRESAAALTRIVVDSLPAQTEYTVGDTLDDTGLSLIAYYDNGTQRKVTGGFTCAPTVLNTAGTQTITVSYGGKSTSFSVAVREKPVSKLSRISVRTLPSKTTYNVGEYLDTSGLTLTAHYDNGSSETVTTGFSCNPAELHSPGAQTITVSYGGKTTSFSVTVLEGPIALTRISVNTPPSKTEYYVGDSLNVSGLTLTAYYNNGASETITGGFSCTPTVLDYAGTQTVVVSYGGKTARFDVTVRERPLILSWIVVSSLPSRTEYFTGESLNTSGLQLTAYYDNGATEVVTAGFACNPTVLTFAGTQTIIVTYNGKSASFNVNVVERNP